MNGKNSTVNATVKLTKTQKEIIDIMKKDEKITIENIAKILERNFNNQKSH